MTPQSSTRGNLASSLSVFPYAAAFSLQKRLLAERQADRVGDLVWYLEHPAVVTWKPGRGEEHFRVPAAEFERQGVALAETDRGGDVTFHGPGQLVGYPIVKLTEPGSLQRDLHRYLRALEEAIIETLRGLEIDAGRIAGKTGVWVGDEKIAAIGVRSSRWVTYHGFALNVDCDLEVFRRLIVPCGIADKGLTSVSRLLGRAPATSALVPELHRALENALGRRLLLTYNGQVVDSPTFT